MRILTVILLTTLLFSFKGFSQVKLPIEYRVEKQSMSTPMTLLEDVIFVNPYFMRPVNIKFDGSQLNMYFDNGATFTKKNVTKVDSEVEYDDDAISVVRDFYTDNSNVSDTILFVVDYNVGYVQVVLPTKNSKGEYVGYTSYQKFGMEEELALK